MYKKITFILILIAQLSFSQSKITGSVINNSNEKIPFATIFLEELNTGVSADIDGFLL